MRDESIFERYFIIIEDLCARRRERKREYIKVCMHCVRRAGTFTLMSMIVNVPRGREKEKKMADDGCYIPLIRLIELVSYVVAFIVPALQKQSRSLVRSARGR